MHICFLTHEYPKPGFPHGGIGTFVKTIGSQLMQAGHTVSVVGVGYNSTDEIENDNGVTIYRLAPGNIKGLNWYLNTRKINKCLHSINETDPIDIIESSERGLFAIKKLRGIKYIIRMHGGHHFFAESENRKIDWWKGYQEKQSFRNADKIIGVGQYVMDHTAKYIEYENKRGQVIYNPANFSKFYQADHSKIIPGRIFFAGTICEKKGIRQLVQAMSSIKEAVPEAHLFIAGRDWFYPDGRSYIEYLRKFITPDIIDSIQILGQLPNEDIPGYIEQAEVCVYPSHMEAMPIAWIEVLSMGKAIVASEKGPGSEVITHGETGMQCNPLDPNDIAEKVIYLLKNKEKAIELGRNARVDVLNRFNPILILQKNLDFYKSIIN